MFTTVSPQPAGGIFQRILKNLLWEFISRRVRAQDGQAHALLQPFLAAIFHRTNRTLIGAAGVLVEAGG